MTIRSLSGWKVLSAILLAFLFLCHCPDARAGTGYTVRKGDTLSGIAHRYGVSVRALRKVNKVEATRLRPGTKIVIPVKDGAAAKKAGAGNSASNTQERTVYRNDDLKPVRQSASDLYHTVKKGDTLSSIASKYSVSIADLKNLNGLRTSKLKRGQRLLIRMAGPGTYIVRRGDSLRKIARRFNIDPDDLMEINEMETPVVWEGQKIYLQETVDDSSEEKQDVTIGSNTGEDVASVSEPGAAGDSTPGRLVAFARKMLNIPYKFGGNSILGIDCSAYVRRVYGLFGIDLPRTAREQFNSGEPINRDQLSVGDLVFFRTYAAFPSHVGIYLGNNLFIHASSKGRKVTISSLNAPYFIKRFMGAKRLLTGGFLEGLSDSGNSAAPDEGPGD